MAAAEQTLYQNLTRELLNMLDCFMNLVKASRIPDEYAAAVETAQSKERKSPGDLLEVWAEKLAFSAYMCLHHVAELKKGAALPDADTLVASLRKVRDSLKSTCDGVESELTLLQRDVHGLLGRLEASYYSNPGMRASEAGATAAAVLPATGADGSAQQKVSGGAMGAAPGSLQLQQLCQLALEVPGQGSNR